MAADAGQLAATDLAGEYCRKSTWIRFPLASQKLPRPLFLMGAALNLRSELPYAVQRFTSLKWKAHLCSVIQNGNYDAIICDFLFPASSLPWDIHAGSRVPWILFQHNVESLIWKRRAETRRGFGKGYLRDQWKRMESFEKRSCAAFDAVLSVSDEDSRVMREDYALPNVLGAVPTGVDVEYFQQIPRQLAAKPTVVFVGSMDWYANVDAVKAFVAESWPQVRAAVPEARLQIVGRQPSADILALAGEAQGIEVTGTVPDVRPYLRAAHAMVVPLRIGGGTRLKIYEAMAAEVPVVSTSIGAEGLPVTDGQHIVLGETSQTLAEGVTRLLTQPDLARDIAAAALQQVAIPFSWQAAAKQMETYCLQAIANKPTHA